MSYAPCGAALRSGQPARHHTDWCSKCRRIADKRRPLVERLITRLRELEATVELYTRRGYTGFESPEVAIYSREARTYRRLLCRLWKQPGQWTVEAIKLADHGARAAYSAPVARRVYCADATVSCLTCGKPLSVNGYVYQVPRLGKFAGCALHVSEANAAALAALSAKYPQTTYTRTG